MLTRRVLWLALVATTVAAIGQSVWSRSMPMTEAQIRALAEPTSTAVTKKKCAANHNVGKISLCNTNFGTFGAGFTSTAGINFDCFTGATLKSCEFPKGSGASYLYAGSFWIGAVVGSDTCVTTAADGWQICREMDPEESPIGDLKQLSIRNPLDIGAKSEQDLIGVYTDRYTTGVTGLCTVTNDPVGHLGHRPLNIQVEERSYAWSYSYAEDFVLFDYTITNTGSRTLTNVYMGVYVDADVGGTGTDPVVYAQDDVTGFLDSVKTPLAFSGGCVDSTVLPDTTFYWKDETNLAWIADNDGDYDRPTPVKGITGTRIVRTPSDQLRVSYNWWISPQSGTLFDYGPMMVDRVRDLGTGGRGTPEGDHNKYYYLRNGEFDYDQVFTCEYADSASWEPVNSTVCAALSKGFDTRYLLSFGPFNIFPGEDLPLSFAYVAGDNFHRTQANGYNLTRVLNPRAWYAGVDFSDLSLNGIWASMLYDNPGVASPGNQDPTNIGKYRICTATGQPDTIYYTGDGIPDFKGASPPPAPDLWLYPLDNKVRVRWNGFRSETTKDVFSKVRDFEGYRVYYALDDRPASFSRIQSFDLEDFNKYIFNPTLGAFELKNIPFKLDSLQRLYGGPDSTRWSSFDPLRYTAINPYRMPGHSDSIFYFLAQDDNQSLTAPGQKIRKIYPTAPFPHYALPDSVPVDSQAIYLTDDHHFKYYEYEMIVDSLLPTIPYYFTVTAFDFGSPASGLKSLETSPTVGYKSTYATGSYARGTSTNKEAYVFPNPYRADGGYQANSFEGRDPISRGKAPDRQRRIHFANVPAKCTIKIFTLDGDLVRELHFPDPLSPCQEDPTVVCWDMITRNTQLVVSGIYYWTVEDEQGNTQIGKLVIIM